MCVCGVVVVVGGGGGGLGATGRGGVPTTGHGVVADGSVGSGSTVIGFPIA